MMVNRQRYNTTDSTEIQEDANTVMTPSTGANGSDPLAKHVSDMADLMHILSESHLWLCGCLKAEN